MKRKVLIVPILILFIFTLLPLPVSAIVLVPCGRNVASTDVSGKPCTLQHLIQAIMRMINYLISVAGIVAIYQILLAGFNLITALGNEDKIKSAKEGISNAVVGFAIVILAFVFVNLLVNGIFSRADSQKRWWDIACLYDITNTKDIEQACPLASH